MNLCWIIVGLSIILGIIGVLILDSLNMGISKSIESVGFAWFYITSIFVSICLFGQYGLRYIKKYDYWIPLTVSIIFSILSSIFVIIIYVYYSYSAGKSLILSYLGGYIVFIVISDLIYPRLIDTDSLKRLISAVAFLEKNKYDYKIIKNSTWQREYLENNSLIAEVDGTFLLTDKYSKIIYPILANIIRKNSNRPCFPDCAVKNHRKGLENAYRLL